MFLTLSPEITELAVLSDYRESNGIGNHSIGMLLGALVYANRPRNVLEIGYNRGFSTAWMCMGAKMAGINTQVVSVDLHPCDGGEKVRELGFDNHHYIQSDSKIARPKVEALIGPELDFLFIDGDHSYEGVKADWTIYSPMLSDRGIAFLHDTYTEEIQRVIKEMDPEWNVCFLGGWAALSAIRKDKYFKATKNHPYMSSSL